MAVSTAALPGTAHGLRTERSIKADLENLEEFKAEYDRLDQEHDSVDRELKAAEQVIASSTPEFERLQNVPGKPGAARTKEMADLSARIEEAKSRVEALSARSHQLASQKAKYLWFYENYEDVRQHLQDELADLRGKPAQPEPQVAASATAQETPQAETPPAAPAIDYTAELRRLGYNEREIAILQDRNLHANVVAGQVRRDRFYKETAWFRTAVDAPASARPTNVRRRTVRETIVERYQSNPAAGILLLVALLVILALVLWAFWPKAQTRVETTPAPTALAIASARAATFLDEPISQGIGPDRNRVYAFTSVPTTARLIDIERDVVVAEDKTSSQLHKLDWTVPTFADLEKTFKLKVEISTSGAYGAGQPVTVKPIDVRVLKNSVAAGGTTQLAQLPDALRVPTNQVGRDALVSVLRSVALDRPGVSGVNSANIADFVQANLSRFKRVPLDRTLTGQFAFVGADGIVRYAPVTIPAGEPVITFDDILLASALCNNVTAPPSGPTPSPRVVVTPTPTPTTTATPAPTSPPCCTFVPTPTPAPTPTPVGTKNPSNAPLGGGSPTPMPPSQAPAPTYTPPPAVGSNIVVTYSQSCGTGCQEIRWTASGSVSASILYGLTGNSMTNFKSASSSGSYWYVQIKNLSPGQSYTFTVSVWYANNVQERTNGSFTAP